MDYSKISISKLVELIGEGATKDLLSYFSCPCNEDIEIFLKEKAIEASKHGTAETHLLIGTNDDEQHDILGYFTLSLARPLIVDKPSDSNFSKKIQKRIKEFGDLEGDMYVISCPLIAQLSKNFYNNLNEVIEGSELLDNVFDTIKEVQECIGGKFTYLECEDTKKLTDFYEEHGFKKCGVRKTSNNKELVKMFKYM